VKKWLFGWDFIKLQSLIEEKRKEGDEKLREYVNTRSNNLWNEPPLFWYGEVKCVEVLIKAGADVNAKNINGDTPLFFGKDKRAIKVLIKAGANVNAKNNRNETPLDNYRVLGVYKDIMTKRLQSFCKKNFKYFVFKHWIKSLEGVEWLYHPKRGGKYVQRTMYNQLRSREDKAS